MTVETPICDFLEQYAKADPIRLHMPGHKGKGAPEALYDLTEVAGADSLYEASGIIRRSEDIASRLYGGRSFYSTEGSSLAIRAMLYLTVLYAKQTGRPCHVAAARNVHRSFLSGAALMDLTVDFLAGEGTDYLSCPLAPEEVAAYLDRTRRRPVALFVTSPDYLGHTQDLAALAEVCHKRDVLLLVDNAHGAYLRFLSPSRHPLDLGADACCDSAHKTLPALTGTAYLHIGKGAPSLFAERAKEAMAIFGSTSPSYLLLSSLDRLNPYLAGEFPDHLAMAVSRVAHAAEALRACGYMTVADEPLKLTLAPKSYGYTGTELSAHLEREGIVAEFADPDYQVLMPSASTTAEELNRLVEILSSLPKKTKILQNPPPFSAPKRAVSLREAVVSPSETCSVEQAVGRTVSYLAVSCPPAVPPVLPGEVLSEAGAEALRYYGYTTLLVLANAKRRGPR